MLAIAGGREVCVSFVSSFPLRETRLRYPSSTLCLQDLVMGHRAIVAERELGHAPTVNC